MTTSSQTRDNEYLNIVTDSLDICHNYKPKFGHGTGVTLAEFQAMYQTDLFYSWFGLDSPLLYTAHRTAGGMTSLYRQIGIGCQRLIQRILMDRLDLALEQASWSYTVAKSGGGERSLSLDGRISIEAVRNIHRRKTVDRWLQSACKMANVSDIIARVIMGAVFEIRQGYKSKDSKRQNADIANAASAYSAGYLPVLMLLSAQIDDDVAARYKNAHWLILYGTTSGSTTTSTYKFCNQILGYDLAGFFTRNSGQLRQKVESILTLLLK